MPRVSVIVPIYNTELYVARCLNSVLLQTVSDIEIICVNDCSSDKSAQVVKGFIRNDSRIRLINHNVNLGPGGARNTGIKAARSEYISFVDSDDYVDPNFLEYLYAATDSGRVDITSCGYRVVDEIGGTRWEHSPEDRIFGSLAENSVLWTATHPHFCDKLWRKALFTEGDIWCPENSYWEDVYAIPKILFNARSFKSGGQVLYHYFNRAGSITNSSGKKHLIDLLLAIDSVKDFLIEKGVYKKEAGPFKTFYEGLFSFHAKRIEQIGTSSINETDKFVRLCALLSRGYSEFDNQLRTAHRPLA